MPGGEDVEIDAQVVKSGRSVATITVSLRRQSTGTLVAQGTHVKFIAQPGIEKKDNLSVERPVSKL